MTMIGKPLTDVRSQVLRDVHAYWERKRGDRRMPARDDLDPLDFPALLPNVILVDEIDFGEEGQTIQDEYAAAATEANAIFTDHRFRELGGHTFDIERVILPLSDDGASATMLMVVLDFTQRHERSEMPL